MNTSNKNTETKVLLITNLQRPFSSQQLNDLISKTGTIIKIWLDQIKTHCLVELETVEQAIKTKEALNGVTWPIDGKKLSIEFSNENELNFAIEKKTSIYSLNNEKENFNISEREKEFMRNMISNKEELANLNISNQNQISNVNASNQNLNNASSEKETVKTLDTLFKKTNTKPNIYYLPLSSEEVMEKKKRLNII